MPLPDTAPGFFPFDGRRHAHKIIGNVQAHAKVVRKVVAHSGPQIVHTAIAIGTAFEAHAEAPPRIKPFVIVSWPSVRCSNPRLWTDLECIVRRRAGAHAGD